MVSDLNTHGYRDAGGQETLLLVAPVLYCAEIASKQAASGPPRNDAFFGFNPTKKAPVTRGRFVLYVDVTEISIFCVNRFCNTVIVCLQALFKQLAGYVDAGFYGTDRYF